MKKLHTKDILKKGAKIKAVKLDENDLTVSSLVDKTIEEQKRILDLLKIPYKIFEDRITI
jgi:uncharacterized Zn ribbon protein